MANLCIPRCEQIQQIPDYPTAPTKLSFCGKDGRPIPETMARRNARERTRVHQLNATFDVLKKRLPPTWRKRRLSKCGILRQSTEYIKFLLQELSKPSQEDANGDGRFAGSELCEQFSDSYPLCEQMMEIYNNVPGSYANPSDGSFGNTSPIGRDMTQYEHGANFSFVSGDQVYEHDNFSSCMYERERNKTASIDELQDLIDSPYTQL